ncbi:hypothetical protein GGR50DRAFT_671967, partial [Xylaria sp. CBS 124048]
MRQHESEACKKSWGVGLGIVIPSGYDVEGWYLWDIGPRIIELTTFFVVLYLILCILLMMCPYIYICF